MIQRTPVYRAVPPPVLEGPYAGRESQQPQPGRPSVRDVQQEMARRGLLPPPRRGRAAGTCPCGVTTDRLIKRLCPTCYHREWARAAAAAKAEKGGAK